MTTLGRRSLLGGIAALLVAPPIVRASSLMKVSTLPLHLKPRALSAQLGDFTIEASGCRARLWHTASGQMLMEIDRTLAKGAGVIVMGTFAETPVIFDDGFRVRATAFCDDGMLSAEIEMIWLRSPWQPLDTPSHFKI